MLGRARRALAEEAGFESPAPPPLSWRPRAQVAEAALPVLCTERRRT